MHWIHDANLFTSIAIQSEIQIRVNEKNTQLCLRYKWMIHSHNSAGYFCCCRNINSQSANWGKNDMRR